MTFVYGTNIIIIIITIINTSIIRLLSRLLLITFLSSFNLNDSSIVFSSSIIGIEVSDIDDEIRIRKVIPSFLEYLYHENMKTKPRDLKKIGLNNLKVDIG